MKTIFPLCLALLVAALLFGCSSVGPTPEQIKEMANSQSAMCVTGAAWNGSPLTAHYTSFGGKSTGTAGGGGKSTCGASTVEFVNEGRAIATPASVSVAAPAALVVPVSVTPVVVPATGAKP